MEHSGPYRPRVEQALRPLYIEGYADQLSYQAGEVVQLHVSTSAPVFALEVARIGAQREVVWREEGLKGAAYDIPEEASAQGCGWPVAHGFTVGDDWRSGYYEATLAVADGGGGFTHWSNRQAAGMLHFAVRSSRPGRDGKILLQLATTTYNAYNNWGGYGLYAYHGRGKVQGHRVSFARPSKGMFFDRWERDFIVWAEAQGYVLDYAVNSDLEFRPELLQHYRLVLSVGHDEYWSAPMRDHLEAFIANGGNAAFFSGNSVCWQVRSEDDGRALVCWKQRFNQDPLYAGGDHGLLSTLWSHHLVGRPENALTGVGFLYGGYHLSHGQFMDGSGAYTVHRPDHWVYEGTGLQQGDEFGGAETIVGYECDGCEFVFKDGLPLATGRFGTPENFVILGTCPARWHPNDSEWYERWERGRTGAATMGVYERGGTVFTAATTDWPHGLAGGDQAVARITRNVLDRLSGGETG